MQDSYSGIEAVAKLARRIHPGYPGHELSASDVETVREVMGFTPYLLMDILPGIPQALRCLGSFFGTNTDLNVLRLAETLKFCSKTLRTAVSDYNSGVPMTYAGFKHQLKANGLYSGFLAPIRVLLEEFFEEQTESSFRHCIQWIDFPTRMNLRSLDLQQQSEDEYIQYEKEMNCWTYPLSLLDEMKEVMAEWMDGFSYDGLVCKHGPGSIAGLNGRPSILEKYANMDSDLLLDYLFQKETGSVLGAQNPLPLRPRPNWRRTSELVCVPKSIQSNRTISKEPVQLQYAQQGVMRAISSHLRKNRILSSHVSLEDQDLSQDLARLGSVSGSYATIDLSNASDSVSYDLVKYVFRGTPLLRGLMCTRSRETQLPSGLRLRLDKFAPMGSSLCFPIECLIFACCCEVACRRSSCRRDYRVYGDDIVILDEAVPSLLKILEDLHFTVNENKSFWGRELTNFREACGGEYLNGQDVTPLRISRRFKASDSPNTISEAETVQSYISFANEAMEKGLYNLRRVILARLKLRFDLFHLLERSYAGSRGIRTYDFVDVNFNLKKRKHVSGRRTEYQYGFRKQIVFESGLNKRRLREFPSWLRQLSDRYADVALVETLKVSQFRRDGLVAPDRIEILPTTTKMVVRWIPDYPEWS